MVVPRNLDAGETQTRADLRETGDHGVGDRRCCVTVEQLQVHPVGLSCARKNASETYDNTNENRMNPKWRRRKKKALINNTWSEIKIEGITVAWAEDARGLLVRG